jgi:hypothetical protein
MIEIRTLFQNSASEPKIQLWQVTDLLDKEPGLIDINEHTGQKELHRGVWGCCIRGVKPLI